jgi:predicted nucleic acid-binding protein
LSETGEEGPDERDVAVVDGSNVAHAEQAAGARLANIRAVCAKLEAEGLRPLVLADARLRHSIDDSDGFEAMVEAGRIRQAPAGTDADYFILSFARELGARVVSNDRFRERAAAFPEVMDRVIRFMIVDGEVVFERRAQRRAD